MDFHHPFSGLLSEENEAAVNAYLASNLGQIELKSMRLIREIDTEINRVTRGPEYRPDIGYCLNLAVSNVLARHEFSLDRSSLN